MLRYIIIIFICFLFFACEKAQKDINFNISSSNKIKSNNSIQKTSLQLTNVNNPPVSLSISNIINEVNKLDILKELYGKVSTSKPLKDEEIKFLIKNTQDILKLKKKFKWNYDLMVAGDHKFYLKFLQLAKPELTEQLGKYGYKEEVAEYYMKWCGSQDNENTLINMAKELEFPDASDYPDEKTFRKEVLHCSQIIVYAADRASDPEVAANLYLKSSLKEYQTDLYPLVQAAKKYTKAHKNDKAIKLLEKVINTPKEKLDFVKPIDGKKVSILRRWSVKNDNIESVREAKKLLKKLKKINTQ